MVISVRTETKDGWRVFHNKPKFKIKELKTLYRKYLEKYGNKEIAFQQAIDHVAGYPYVFLFNIIRTWPEDIAMTAIRKIVDRTWKRLRRQYALLSYTPVGEYALRLEFVTPKKKKQIDPILDIMEYLFDYRFYAIIQQAIDEDWVEELAEWMRVARPGFNAHNYFFKFAEELNMSYKEYVEKVLEEAKRNGEI